MTNYTNHREAAVDHLADSQYYATKQAYPRAAILAQLAQVEATLAVAATFAELNDSAMSVFWSVLAQGERR